MEGNGNHWGNKPFLGPRFRACSGRVLCWVAGEVQLMGQSMWVGIEMLAISKRVHLKQRV